MKATLTRTEKRLQSARYVVRSDQPKKPPKSAYHQCSSDDFSVLEDLEKRRKFEQ